MRISTKVFSLALGAVLAANISPAWAQRTDAAANAADGEEKQEEILFKIHDIVPVQNREGEVIACDFNTTVYNRSTYDLREAVLDFTWKDTSIEDVVKAEKEEDAEKNKRPGRRAHSETERRTSQEVNVQVEVSSLKPYQQVTLSNRVNSDRCFLLVQNVEFDVQNCSAEGLSSGGGKGARRGRGNNSCTKLFKFVAPESAQYYMDFKEITLDEEKAKENAEKQASKDETVNIYTKTVNSLNSASSIISGIK